LEVLERSDSTPQPFVLLSLDGDPPLKENMQNRIRRLRGLRACFATNLQKAVDSEIFFPLPQGMCYHGQGIYENDISMVRPIGSASALPNITEAGADLDTQFEMERARMLTTIKKAAAPWQERKKKLLVTGMGPTSKTRAQYTDILGRAEFANVVDIAEARLPLYEFLTKIAEYQAVLSPVGQGYDCFRHWESLAVGTVPLVMKDDAMDLRLFDDTGAAFMPDPDRLTHGTLKEVLDKLNDPEKFAHTLLAEHWHQRWKSHLASQGK
jgi:hypothetical protein